MDTGLGGLSWRTLLLLWREVAWDGGKTFILEFNIMK